MQRAEFFRDQGLVAITIDYRLTCNPQDALASVADTGLCRGSGHGTPGTAGLEVLEDAQEAVVHVRNNAATYRIDPTKGVGALGVSSGGLQAANLAVMGSEGTTRVDAAVTWSGCLHMEIPNTGHSTPHPLRERLVGCPYSGTGSCPGAWDQYSP